ncbi:MAG: hypothetical protein CMK59_06075 [Proteobacteria bacterium]|nr:hypothetical protein [Pseudomonadota bacterium]
MNEPTDQALLNAYVKGNERSFAVLMERHARALKAYALRLLKNQEQAEDVCSETFLRLAIHKNNLGGKEKSVRSYIFTIAHNLCMDRFRRLRTQRMHAENVLDLTVVQQSLPSPEAVAILGERAAMLEEAISRLGSEHRQVILLRSTHGFSAKETAEIMGIDSKQIDSLFSYAKKKLRMELASLAREIKEQGGV